MPTNCSPAVPLAGLQSPIRWVEKALEMVTTRAYVETPYRGAASTSTAHVLHACHFPSFSAFTGPLGYASGFRGHCPALAGLCNTPIHPGLPSWEENAADDSKSVSYDWCRRKPRRC